MQLYTKESKCVQEGCVDSFSVAVHPAYSVTVRIILDDEVSDSASDGLSGLGYGADDVKFAGVFIDYMDGVGETAWGGFG